MDEVEDFVAVFVAEVGEVAGEGLEAVAEDGFLEGGVEAAEGFEWEVWVAGEPGVGFFGEEVYRFAEELGVVGGGFDEVGVDCLEEGNDVVADAVAGEVAGEVAGVAEVGDLAGVEVGEDFLFGDGEEGAKQRPVEYAHAGQAGEGGAAAEVHDDGFEVVVGVVGGEDEGAVVFLGQRAQELVAFCAAGFFEAAAP